MMIDDDGNVDDDDDDHYNDNDDDTTTKTMMTHHEIMMVDDDDNDDKFVGWIYCSNVPVHSMRIIICTIGRIHCGYWYFYFSGMLQG